MTTVSDTEKIAQLKIEEPQRRTIQVGIASVPHPCISAIGYAVQSLGDSASHDPVTAVELAIDNLGKSDWLDISKELPKDLATTLLRRAEMHGVMGLEICQCGNAFSIRLSDTE